MAAPQRVLEVLRGSRGTSVVLWSVSLTGALTIVESGSDVSVDDVWFLAARTAVAGLFTLGLLLWGLALARSSRRR